MEYKIASFIHNQAPERISITNLVFHVRGLIVAIALGLLMLGYLGGNLFQMAPQAITFIRFTTLFAITFLLATNRHLSYVQKPPLIFGAISLLGAIASSISLNLAFICLFVLALPYFSVTFVARVSMYYFGFAIVMTLFLLNVGAIDNFVDSVGFINGVENISHELRERNTFGFKNVNAFASLVSGFCILLMFTGKRVLLSYGTSITICYLFYLYTDSRAMLLVTISFIIYSFVFLLLNKYRRIFGLVTFITMVAPFISIITLFMLPDWLPLIDMFLSGRLSFGNTYVSTLPVFPLLLGGAEPPFDLTVDNAFALLVGAVGFPASFYLLLRIWVGLSQCIHNLDWRTYSLVSSLYIYSFFESSILRPESIICIVFWMIVLNKDFNKPRMPKNIRNV